MAETVTQHNKRVRAEVSDNIERVRSLAEADNVDGVAELSEETEVLIADLPAKDRTKFRAELREAGEARESVQQSSALESRETQDYHAVEGVDELVTMGTQKVVDGVNQHIKTSATAKEVATIILDMWRRMTTKDGAPDILGRSPQAKQAASDMYASAGEALGEDESKDAYDVDQAVKKLIRAVQQQRADARAEYLRSLDDKGKEADAERAYFAEILAKKPKGTPASQFVADYYGASLKGPTELARERYHAKKELEESAGDGGTDDPGTPDERATVAMRRIRTGFRKIETADFENASEETKDAIRAQLEEAAKTLRALIAATSV